MDLEEIKKSFFSALAGVQSAQQLENLRVKFLGRQAGQLTEILHSLKNLPVEKRREIGPAANTLRDKIEEALQGKLKELETVGVMEGEIDLTRPGTKIRHGHLHPLTLVEQDVVRIFRSLNFSIMEGPEIETEYYNFDALNIPPNHPAREMWDTFWLKPHETKSHLGFAQGRTGGLARPDLKNKSGLGQKDRLLLRTHTSPMQIRFMEQHNPPFQILVPGRVFRYEATDATHETNFGQFEGLMVGKDISIANFKFVIETFFDKFFNQSASRRIRFRYRPSYFPFTEPSIEVDIRMPNSSHQPPATSQPEWLEMMGAGMVHPKVFEAVRYNPHEWQGFAFGMSLERLAMIKYKIPDIRLFYSGDLRFIEQF